MIDSKIRKEKILFECFSKLNIDELIEEFKMSGCMDFSYNGITYMVNDESKGDGKYYPSIRIIKEGQSYDEEMASVQFFDSYDDLIENFRFPTGKKFIDVLFTKPSSKEDKLKVLITKKDEYEEEVEWCNLMYTCPKCKKTLIWYPFRYCPSCGVELDWAEEVKKDY